MDADYARNEQAPPFAQSLFVLTTVMSAPRPDLAVVDAGLKALAFDSGPPVVWNRPGVTYAGASDEHGKLVITGGAEPPRLGEKLRLQPGHCDPTVDRYDWYVGFRGPGRVPMARGGPRRNDVATFRLGSGERAGAEALPRGAGRRGWDDAARFDARSQSPLTQANGQQRRSRIRQSVDDVKVMLAAFRRPRARPGFG